MRIYLERFLHGVPGKRAFSDNLLDLVVFAIVLVYGGICNITMDDSTPRWVCNGCSERKCLELANEASQHTLAQPEI